jgi:hypothetical protein
MAQKFRIRPVPDSHGQKVPDPTWSESTTLYEGTELSEVWYRALFVTEFGVSEAALSRLLQNLRLHRLLRSFQFISKQEERMRI